MNTAYLLIPHMRIRNANAVGSPWTIGFPAMTAWLGAVHGLERTLKKSAPWHGIHFPAIALSCHACDLQVYRGMGDWVNSISVTANPLRKKGAGFERPPFIEDARVHLEVSLLIKVEGVDADQEERFLDAASQCLQGMKIAAGDIICWKTPSVIHTANEADERKLLFRLMPGYVLIERRELLAEYVRKGMDPLDAVLTLMSVHQHLERDGEGTPLRWTYGRAEPGWLIPLAVGFKGISPLGHVANQRDPSIPHQFVETVVTVGEFKMPYRFSHIDEILWHYEYGPEHHLYLCSNENQGGHNDGKK